MWLSERSGLDRAPNRLTEALDALRRAGNPVVDLTVSNPTTAGIEYESEALGRALAHPRSLRYEPHSLGAPGAREAICASWAELGVDVTAERVLITATTSEAYGYLFKLLCDPGDQVLIPSPSYPLFEHLARFEAVQPVPYPLRFDGAWHIDFPELERRLGPRTRAIALVNPNNPTGSFVKVDELERLAHLGLPLISDEVFARYPLAPPRLAARSALGTPGALVFALSGLSKLAALPQLKLAWITASGPPELVTEAMIRLELIADTYLSPSAPVALALSELLELSRSSRHAVQRRIQNNAETLGRLLARSPISLRPIEGGWYAVLRLPNTRDEETWVLGLLREAGVLVQPGYFFDFEDEPYAVLSLLTPEHDLALGVGRLVSYVSDG
ncbi:MAG TPA: pyridoxal phosphate-dependent aminotransferase [Polyangiaceae bacterium]